MQHGEERIRTPAEELILRRQSQREALQQDHQNPIAQLGSVAAGDSLHAAKHEQGGIRVQSRAARSQDGRFPFDPRRQPGQWIDPGAGFGLLRRLDTMKALFQFVDYLDRLVALPLGFCAHRFEALR